MGVVPPTLALSGTHAWLASLVYSLASSSFIYHVIRRMPLGAPRLALSLPVLVANTFVPWFFDPATHTICTAVIFCIVAWVASFRLVMFCFGFGPYADPWVSSTYPRFAAIVALPVRICPVSDTSAPPRSGATSALSWLGRAVGVTEGASGASGADAWSALAVRAALKTVVLGAMLRLYDYREEMPESALHVLHSANLYLFVTAVLEVLSAAAIAAVGVELDPVFDKPFLAVSFQEFWARRWNLVISNLLREAIYEPVTHLLIRAERPKPPPTPTVTPPKRENNARQEEETSQDDQKAELEDSHMGLAHVAPAHVPSHVRVVAVMASFFVSGIMHELAVYYLCYHMTGEMLLFFMLHGLFVVCESAIRIRSKRSSHGKKGRSTFGKAARIGFTVGVALITGEYLFWAPIVRYKLDIAVVNQIRRFLGVD